MVCMYCLNDGVNVWEERERRRWRNGENSIDDEDAVNAMTTTRRDVVVFAAAASAMLPRRDVDTAKAGPLLEMRRRERDDARIALDSAEKVANETSENDTSASDASLEAQGRAYLAENEAARIERNVDYLEKTLESLRGGGGDVVLFQRAVIAVDNLDQEVDFWTIGLGMSPSREGRTSSGACA